MRTCLKRLSQGAVIAALSSSSAMAGTLYKSDSFVPLTSDFRSFHVGDALTVMIVESSTAESDAESTQGRDFKLTGSVQAASKQQTISGELGRQSDDSGSTRRNGQLQAELSVHIQSVAANGDLVLRGAQTITVNGETQRIELSGVARPIDVSADNVVLSTRLSNAQIDYIGKGFVERSQHQGLISRLLDYLGL